jgi:hypothetical protein
VVTYRPELGIRDETRFGKINRKGIWIIKPKVTTDMAFLEESSQNSFNVETEIILSISGINRPLINLLHTHRCVPNSSKREAERTVILLSSEIRRKRA